MFKRCFTLFVAIVFPASGTAQPAPGGPPETELAGAAFAKCEGANRVTCVVDGDTFWLYGAKIRIADINTPETHSPACADEARLGEAATLRLISLLNAGPFQLVNGARDRDRYGRLLRVVERRGTSIGGILVAEGLAERWQGKRGDWCRPA